MTPKSSSPERNWVINVRPTDRMPAEHLAQAIAGHAQIVAAIANHGEREETRAIAIGNLSGAPQL